MASGSDRGLPAQFGGRRIRPAARRRAEGSLRCNSGSDFCWVQHRLHAIIRGGMPRNGILRPI